MQVARDGFRVVSMAVPAFFRRKIAVEQGCVEVVRQGVHALFEGSAVVGQCSVPRVAGMEFIGALTAQADFDVVGHVFKQRMEEHDRHIGVLPVPGEFG